MLSGYQSHPGGELSSLPEGRTVADRSYDRGCHQRADARNLAQSLACGIAGGNPLDFRVHLCNMKFQLLPLAPHHRYQVAHPWSQVLLHVLEHAWYRFSEANRALGKTHASLPKE